MNYSRYDNLSQGDLGPAAGSKRRHQYSGRGRNSSSSTTGGRNHHQDSKHSKDHGAASGGLQLETSLDSVPPHLTDFMKRWKSLITKEFDAEQAVVKGRLEHWSLDRLQREGLVLLGLAASKHGRLYGVPVWILRTADRRPMPFHKFMTGDEVLISKGNPQQGRTFSGTVLERGNWELRIVSNDNLPTGNTELRVDKGVNTVVYERMRAALNSLVKQPLSQYDQQIQQQQQAALDAINDYVKSSTDDDETIADDEFEHGWPMLISNQLHQKRQQKEAHKQQKKHLKHQRKQRREQKRHSERQRQSNLALPGTCLADLLVSPTAALAAMPSGLMPASAVNWAQGVLAQHGSSQDLIAQDSELGLNRSQTAAVASCIVNKLSLIHGPPGTGKTTTTVTLLAQLVKRWQLPFPLLAVGQSHVAVDNLLEGLVDAGVNAVRLGQPFKVRASLRNATLDAMLEAHPRRNQVEDAAQQLRELRASLPSLPGRDKGLGHRDAAILNGKVEKMRQELVSEVIKGAQVICATCAAAGSDMLAGITFPLVVIDEASQAAEPEALIPLTRGAEHVVLVGDHLQLPPVCNSEEAAAAGLSVSLFEKLMAAGIPSAMLQVQYRMHPCLSAFPNTAFYNGRLTDGVSVEQRPSPQPFPWPRPDLPLLFVDVSEGQEELVEGGSKLNRAEADMVQQVLKHLLHVCCERVSSVGVVTPYQAQLNLLSQKLSGLTAKHQQQQYMSSPPVLQQQQQYHFPPPVQQQQYPPPPPLPQQGAAAAGIYNSSYEPADAVLEIKTVDGYQGREKEVVVFSAVRANAHAQVGFLEDWRRLNVAITRPRRGLVLLGHGTTLSSGDKIWAMYLAWLQQQGCVVHARRLTQQLAAAAVVGAVPSLYNA